MNFCVHATELAITGGHQTFSDQNWNILMKINLCGQFVRPKGNPYHFVWLLIIDHEVLEDSDRGGGGERRREIMSGQTWEWEDMLSGQIWNLIANSDAIPLYRNPLAANHGFWTWAEIGLCGPIAGLYPGIRTIISCIQDHSLLFEYKSTLLFKWTITSNTNLIAGTQHH